MLSKKGLLLLLATVIIGCSGDTVVPDNRPAVARGSVDDQRIIEAPEAEPGSWLSYGQTYKEQRFSQLNQINQSNINDLGIVWHKSIGDFNQRMQGTPLVVDGTMYVTNGWSVVWALDAVTGEELWRYDPEVDRSYIKLACCGPAHNRGVAVYQGKVYVATFDGRLIAIDAEDGTQVWDIDTWHPSALGRFNISGAPRVAAGKIYIGNGSSESQKRRGYVTAYDAETGELAWRFYLVPGDPSKPFEHPEMEMAAKTWGGEWWKFGGGGTAWNSLVYDEELNSLYIGVGNGAPWPRMIRSPGGGDDLFLTAIVSVDVDSGRMNWYYQTVPGDNWDYSSAMDITLTTMDVDGVERKVLLQAPKNGFFYVIDRETGELLRAHPYTEQINWATHVDIETGRPVENPSVVYERDPQWIIPANAGAHNWEPQSWDDARGLMYFYYHDYANFYSLDEEFVETGVYRIRERGLSLGIGEGEYRRKLMENAPPRPETVGYVGAFDPLSGRYKWRHRLDTGFNGGVLATAGDLLFHAEGVGQFTARNIETGDVLWRYATRGPAVGAVVSYAIEGTQYVATMAGASRADNMVGQLLVFALGGDKSLPLGERDVRVVPDQPEVFVDMESYGLGDTLYHAQCASCHGGIGVPMEVATTAPDLRFMNTQTHADFKAIVLDGIRAEAGMAGFADFLSEEQLEYIRAYLVTEANGLKSSQDRGSTDEQADSRG